MAETAAGSTVDTQSRLDGWWILTCCIDQAVYTYISPCHTIIILQELGAARSRGDGNSNSKAYYLFVVNNLGKKTHSK